MNRSACGDAVQLFAIIFVAVSNLRHIKGHVTLPAHYCLLKIRTLINKLVIWSEELTPRLLAIKLYKCHF